MDGFRARPFGSGCLVQVRASLAGFPRPSFAHSAKFETTISVERISKPLANMRINFLRQR